MKIKSLYLKGFVYMFVIGFLGLSACSKQSYISMDDDNKSTHVEVEGAADNNITIDTSMSITEINDKIASANSGDTVYIKEGVYHIDQQIKLKQGVVLAKKTNTNPIFDAKKYSLSELYTLRYSSELTDGGFYGITFWNIRFVIDSAQRFKFRYCIFDYGIRKVNTDESYYADAYIQLSNTDSALIQNCVFSRRNGNSGRGIWLKPGVINNTITNCTFGNGTTTGYFVTAINDNSQSNSVIQSNTILRNPDLNIDDLQTDHGIYAHSFNGLTIKNNTISGWPANGSGGAIKARNGQQLNITNNQFTNSGILLYEYVDEDYPYLKYVQISNNIINIDSAANDLYHGIGYWRNNTAGIEYSIRIADNSLSNGSIYISNSNMDTASFNAENGGVFNNDTNTFSIPLGINNSGNF